MAGLCLLLNNVCKVVLTVSYMACDYRWRDMLWFMYVLYVNNVASCSFG